jgi:hypothetical protein
LAAFHNSLAAVKPCVLHLSRRTRAARSMQKTTIVFPERFIRDTLGSGRIDFSVAK